MTWLTDVVVYVMVTMIVTSAVALWTSWSFFGQVERDDDSV